jgi:4a-hydroxytetrahydrobiopterin dehydratase
MTDPTISTLTDDELALALAQLPQWTFDAPRRAIVRRIVLADFSQAMGAMMRIALEAEKADHHPEWSNVYNRLDIHLTTHDANGVSRRDIDLARVIDAITADYHRAER